MRLRNLFLLLLLCMTVGVFSVACTGDDGAQGPPGPQGEQGPPGEDGDDGDGGDSTRTYDFLKTWGSETGTIACSDSLLQDTAGFPGPSELEPITAGTPPMPAPVSLEVTCNDNVFDSTTLGPAAAASVTDVVADITDVVAGSLVFVKAGTATVSNASDPEVVPSTEVSAARTVVTTKMFSGGPFFAKMDTSGGNNEAFDRRLLHSDCGIGERPPAIKGEWRGVEIEDVSTGIDPRTKTPFVDTNDDPSDVMTTKTTKVCVRLDSVPGTVKCFIKVDGPAANDVTQQIATYDGTQPEGMRISTVVAGMGAAGADKLLASQASPAPIEQNFVGAGNLLSQEVGSLCNLFEGGVTPQ